MKKRYIITNSAIKAMKKFLMLSIVLNFLFSNKGFGQDFKIEEWYLEYLFQTAANYSYQNKQIGLPILWEPYHSKSFLLNKLDSPQKGTAIMLMGLSRDTSFSKVLLEYADSEDEPLSRLAMQSIAKIGGPDAANLLNRTLIRHANDPIAAQEILYHMKLLADSSTLQSINKYLQTLQPINEINKKLSAIAKDVIEIIMAFNSDPGSRRQFIISNLNNYDNPG